MITDATRSTKHAELNEANDRNTAHFTTIERRTTWPPARATCSCGWSHEWTATLIAEQDAEWHREEVATKEAPTITIERKVVTRSELFRWRCSCGRTGVWLETEQVARRNSALHVDHVDKANEPIANASGIDDSSL